MMGPMTKYSTFIAAYTDVPLTFQHSDTCERMDLPALGRISSSGHSPLL